MFDVRSPMLWLQYGSMQRRLRRRYNELWLAPRADAAEQPAASPGAAEAARAGAPSAAAQTPTGAASAPPRRPPPTFISSLQATPAPPLLLPPPPPPPAELQQAHLAPTSAVATSSSHQGAAAQHASQHGQTEFRGGGPESSAAASPPTLSGHAAQVAAPAPTLPLPPNVERGRPSVPAMGQSSHTQAVGAEHAVPSAVAQAPLDQDTRQWMHWQMQLAHLSLSKVQRSSPQQSLGHPRVEHAASSLSEASSAAQSFEAADSDSGHESSAVVQHDVGTAATKEHAASDGGPVTPWSSAETSPIVSSKQDSSLPHSCDASTSSSTKRTADTSAHSQG